MMTSAGKPFQSIEKLSVVLDFFDQRIDVGTLAWSKDERRVYFQYHPDFAATRLAISPFKLPVTGDAKEAPYAPFGGLHATFNDSLPDGWGRLLLDRRMQKLGFDFRLFTPLDRLAFVGQTGMGALRYIPGRRRTNPGRRASIWIGSPPRLRRSRVKWKKATSSACSNCKAVPRAPVQKS
jgi:HipA N-terminal domain